MTFALLVSILLPVAILDDDKVTNHALKIAGSLKEIVKNRDIEEFQYFHSFSLRKEQEYRNYIFGDPSHKSISVFNVMKDDKLSWKVSMIEKPDNREWFSIIYYSKKYFKSEVDFSVENMKKHWGKYYLETIVYRCKENEHKPCFHDYGFFFQTSYPWIDDY